MKKYQRFTKEEIASVISLRDQGLTYRQIAEKLGREKSQIENLVSRLRKRECIKPQEEVKVSAPVSVKPEKTLKDFEPRDMFKYLYNLGYRIDDKGIYFTVKQYVNLKSIISE